MFSRIYKLFNDNNSIYSLQFGFRQKYSIAHALISLTEDITKISMKKENFYTEVRFF